MPCAALALALAQAHACTTWPSYPPWTQDSDDEDEHGWQALLLDWESTEQSQEAQQDMQHQQQWLASPMKTEQGDRHPHQELGPVGWQTSLTWLAKLTGHIGCHC
jgi:hypothetical protein